MVTLYDREPELNASTAQPFQNIKTKGNEKYPVQIHSCGKIPRSARRVGLECVDCWPNCDILFCSLKYPQKDVLFLTVVDHVTRTTHRKLSHKPQFVFYVGKNTVQ